MQIELMRMSMEFKFVDRARLGSAYKGGGGSKHGRLKKGKMYHKYPGKEEVVKARERLDLVIRLSMGLHYDEMIVEAREWLGREIMDIGEMSLGEVDGFSKFMVDGEIEIRKRWGKYGKKSSNG